jgi:hypothetical protein
MSAEVGGFGGDDAGAGEHGEVIADAAGLRKAVEPGEQ